MEEREILKQIPTKGIYHHSADPSAGNQLAKIDNYHKEQGFPISSYGFFVGYHFLITQQGYVLQVRDIYEVGAHDRGENIGSVGVCFMNNFNENVPNQMEEMAIAMLIERGLKEWNIPITAWEPHRLGDSTDCPGKNIPEKWALKCYLKYKINWYQKLLLWLTRKI